MTQSSNPGTIRDWMQQLNEPMGALPMMMQFIAQSPRTC